MSGIVIKNRGFGIQGAIVSCLPYLFLALRIVQGSLLNRTVGCAGRKRSGTTRRSKRGNRGTVAAS